MLQAFICTRDIVSSSSQGYTYDGLVRVWMETNFRPVKRVVRGGDMASGREKQRKFLQFVALVFMASNTITTVVYVWSYQQEHEMWSYHKLRGLGYSAVNVQMRQETLVLRHVRKLAKNDY
jgi:hypothetical protein